MSWMVGWSVTLLDLSPIPVSALLSGGNADTVLDRVPGVVRNRKNNKRKGVDLGRKKGKGRRERWWSSRKRRWTTLFIGPESDHWQPLSVTNSLTPLRLVDLIDVTLVCEVDNSKLVEVVTVADVDNVGRVGNSLLQIWKPRFGHKAKLLFRL